MPPGGEAKLLGRKVRLRDWRVSDLERYAYWLAPGHLWQELDGPYYAKPTPEQVPAIVAKKRDEIDAGEKPSPRENLVVALHGSDGLIGAVSRAWESRETNWLTVGIVLYDPALWGRGLGYEALGLWGDHLLREMPKLARLDLRTWSGNVGMMRLARKLGFAEEARFRKARVVDGRYYDGLGYGVLREEWDLRYPSGFSEHLRQGEKDPDDPQNGA